MKTVISILLFSFFWILGCDSSPDLSVNSEENNSTGSTTFEKIKLPSPSALWKDSLITMSQTIDGSVGGRLILDKYYMSENGDSILVKVDLRIPAGAFQGIKVITITVDQTDAAVHFYPAMVFADTLRLFQSFEGLNLDGYSTGTIDFVYIRDDGTAELLKKNGTQIILPQGIMRVQNAKLIHFSRYGWVRSPN